MKARSWWYIRVSVTAGGAVVGPSASLFVVGTSWCQYTQPCLQCKFVHGGAPGRQSQLAAQSHSQGKLVQGGTSVCQSQLASGGAGEVLGASGFRVADRGVSPSRRRSRVTVLVQGCSWWCMRQFEQVAQSCSQGKLVHGGTSFVSVSSSSGRRTRVSV